MLSVKIKLILKVNLELDFPGSLPMVKFGDAPGRMLIDTGFMAN